MNKKPIILMTTLYPNALNNSHRFWELKKSLELNLENENITEIIIFFQRKSENFNPLKQGFEFLENPKIKLYFLTNSPIKRPTFKDFFEYANLHYPKQHIVVCNSDIFFYKDSKIERLTELKNHNELWFLTRYSFVEKWKKWVIAPFGRYSSGNDLDRPTPEDTPDFQNWEVVVDFDEYDLLAKELKKDQIKDKNLILGFGTVDSYCFYSPIKETNFDIFIGTAACENYLRLKAIQSGIKILNPAFSIFSRHLHKNESDYGGIFYFNKKDYYKTGYISKTICKLETKKYDNYNSSFKNELGIKLEKCFPNLYKLCEKIYHSQFK